MANAYTSTTAVPQLVVTAYDRLFEFNLRAETLFRSWADKRPAQVTNPGESVVLSLYNDLSPVTAPLTETVTPDAVAIPAASQVTITLNEYGNLTVQTLRLQTDAISNIDVATANMVAFNCADSVDGIVQTVLRTNGNQVYTRAGGAGGLTTNYAGTSAGGPAITATTSADTIHSSDLRAMVATMRTNKAMPRLGNTFVAGIHPYVSADLRSETGAAAWRDPHVYNSAGVANVWDAVVGEYEGLTVLESPRLYSSQAGAGSGGTQTRVFTNYILGQQALAEATNIDFHSVIGEITDPLKRFFPVGWYGFAGWNVYRQQALMRYDCAATGQPSA